MKASMRTSALYGLLVVIAFTAALVPAVFPAMDLAVAGYFLKVDSPIKTTDWLWVTLINEHTPTVFRSIAVLCLPAWLFARRAQRYQHWVLPIAFVGLGLLLGPGLVVSGLKDLTQRARPFHVTAFGGEKQFTPALQITDQCNDNCAFVSGHAADGFFLVGLMLLSRRRRAWWVAFGLISGLVVGFARVSVGAHWLSDVLWAFPVALVSSWVVWVALTRYYLPFPAPQSDFKKAAP